MVLSQVCLGVLVVAVCAAAQTPTKYTYQDTSAKARHGATDQQQTLKGQRYKHAYGNSPVNTDRQYTTGSLHNDYLYPMKRPLSVYPTPGILNNNQPTGYNRHISSGHYPRRQMYDGQDIPNPNYRPSYEYSSSFLYRRQPFSYGRYGVPYNGYSNPYSYRYPVQPTVPSYTQGKPAAYVPYGRGKPYLRDIRYVPNNNDQRKAQNPPSNNSEGKGQRGAGGSGQTMDHGSDAPYHPTVQPRPNGNVLFDGRNPQSPQYGRYPDSNSNRNPRPSGNVDLTAIFGNNSGRQGAGASRQPSDIDINALLKNIGNNSLFGGRPLRPTSMDLGSIYASGGGIQGGVPKGQIVGAPVIYPNGGQQQTILPQRPDVQGAPQGVQGRPVYDPSRPNALPGRGNPRVPTPGGTDAAPQMYPQRNGQSENNGGIILTQEQVEQLFGQSGNSQGSPERLGNQITVPYYGPSSGQPSAQPPTRERPNVSGPAQSGNTGDNQMYPEENNQRQDINQGMPLTPRQQEVTVPYYGPTPGQPPRRPSQPGPNIQRVPQGGDQGYPQGSDPRYPQGSDSIYPQGSGQRYPQGSDPRNPQGGDQRYPQGGIPRYPPESDPRNPQGGNQRYPQESDPRYPQGSDPRNPQGGNQRYPQGGDPRYPQGSGPRNPQGGNQRNPQGGDPRYPQGGDQRYPQGGNQRYPQGGDPRYPQGGDQRYPQGGNQRYPQGGDPRYPQGGDQRYPQGGDQRYPQGSGQGNEGVALTPEQIQNLFGQALPGNPSQDGSNGASRNENPRLTPGQTTDKNPNLPSSSGGGSTQG